MRTQHFSLTSAHSWSADVIFEQNLSFHNFHEISQFEGQVQSLILVVKTDLDRQEKQSEDADLKRYQGAGVREK